MSLNLLLKVILFIGLTSVINATELEKEENIDLVNQKIENSYASVNSYDLKSEEITTLVEENAYTNGEYEKDKDQITKFFGHTKMEPKKEEFLMFMYQEYKKRLEDDKNSMLKALPIAMKMLDEKAKNMNYELIIKEKENPEGIFPIINNQKYYIDWENKILYKADSEEVKNINTDELFRLHYDNVYSYVLLEWPLKRQIDKEDPKTYPIVVIIDNYYGIYFNDLEEKTNAQIKLVEEKGLKYVNPFKN